MAYDLHIENSGRSVEEWISYVESSAHFTLINHIEATNLTSGEKISIETPYSARSSQGLMFQPRVRNGVLTITISDPRTEDITFIKLVSAEFGGAVVGDEGEEY